MIEPNMGSAITKRDCVIACAARWYLFSPELLGATSKDVPESNAPAPWSTRRSLSRNALASLTSKDSPSRTMYQAPTAISPRIAEPICLAKASSVTSS